ncbi:MAG: hypothetical protein IJ422_09695 [Oscillospiraceae bacterium]|nr:hypothetical protein [Oscillospiraceae bacterium]
MPPYERKRVVTDMYTWLDLIQFGMFIIALVSLIVQMTEKEVTAPTFQVSGYFL